MLAIKKPLWYDFIRQNKINQCAILTAQKYQKEFFYVN